MSYIETRTSDAWARVTRGTKYDPAPLAARLIEQDASNVALAVKTVAALDVAHRHTAECFLSAVGDPLGSWDARKDRSSAAFQCAVARAVELVSEIIEN